MAIATGTALAMGGAALLGGIAGSQDQETSSSQTSRIRLREASELENTGERYTLEQLEGLRGIVGAGPGRGDVLAAGRANEQFAQLLQGGISNGFMPNQQDIGNANQFAQAMFAPQQTQLNQQFEDARVQQQRMAAQLGRPINDPVLQNKLMQTQAREQAMLGSQQTAFAAQQAQQMMGQRFQGAQDLATLRSGLASQAFSNRAALLGMGSQIQAQGQNFRLASADRTVSGTQTQHANAGSMIGGALAGAGTVAGFGNMFGGGQQKTATPSIYGLQTGGQTGQYNALSTGFLAG